MNGPRPGIAKAPIPANNPRVPPTTPPVVTPVVVPSGALVFFSCANSFELLVSGSSTEMSSCVNPPPLLSGIQRSDRRRFPPERCFCKYQILLCSCLPYVTPFGLNLLYCLTEI